MNEQLYNQRTSDPAKEAKKTTTATLYILIALVIGFLIAILLILAAI